MPLTDDSEFCRTLSCGLELHSKLSREAYLRIGLDLAQAEASLSWKIGDWLNHGYRHRIVVPDDYDGPRPARQTGYNCAWVCRTFEISRRRKKLTFGHHAELVTYPPNEADKWLDWCEDSIAATGKPRSIRAMRNEIDRRHMEKSRAEREEAQAGAGDPEPRFRTQPLITRIPGSRPFLGENLSAQIQGIIAGLKNPGPRPDAPSAKVFVLFKNRNVVALFSKKAGRSQPAYSSTDNDDFLSWHKNLQDVQDDQDKEEKLQFNP